MRTGSTHAQARRHFQKLPRRPSFERRELRGAAWRNPRAAGRERRRQVHTHQDRRRRLCAGPGRDFLRRRARSAGRRRATPTGTESTSSTRNSFCSRNYPVAENIFVGHERRNAAGHRRPCADAPRSEGTAGTAGRLDRPVAPALDRCRSPTSRWSRSQERWCIGLNCWCSTSRRR